MNIKKLISGWLFAASAALAAPGQAAVLFSDNFDGEAPAGSALNYAGLINWDVSDGSIDFIRQGGYGISCFGSAGGCLDMDGSTGNAGRITSRATFDLIGGAWYWLDAQVSGNQRGGTDDEIVFGLADAAGSPLLSTPFGGIRYFSLFASYSAGFMFAGDTTVRLYVEDTGADNVGVILDNVVFRDAAEGSVPEPGVLALLGLGLAGFAVVRRRSS